MPKKRNNNIVIKKSDQEFMPKPVQNCSASHHAEVVKITEQVMRDYKEAWVKLAEK